LTADPSCLDPVPGRARLDEALTVRVFCLSVCAATTATSILLNGSTLHVMWRASSVTSEFLKVGLLAGLWCCLATGHGCLTTGVSLVAQIIRVLESKVPDVRTRKLVRAHSSDLWRRC
jgi:hypothetical protein